jgi:hypothetical protein
LVSRRKGGTSALPADLLQTFRPWNDTRPPGFEPGNALLANYVLQFKPWRGRSRRASAGRLSVRARVGHGGAVSGAALAVLAAVGDAGVVGARVYAPLGVMC